MEWLLVIGIVVLGLALLLVELVFVPGTTVVGIFGGAVLAVAIYLAYTEMGPAQGTIVLVGTAALAVGMLVYAFKSGSWKKFASNDTIKSKFNDTVALPKEGAEGITLSALRPVGTAEFDGKRFEVRTEGDYLASGQQVKITRIKDQRIIYITPTDTDHA